jgi:regulatory protein
MAVSYSRKTRERPPLDGETLQQAALFYAGRYATTRARLRLYLLRKLRERGWAGEGEPPVEALVERLARLGYVDDRAFAAAKSASLVRRGFGERRVGAALRAAGIEEEDSREAREAAGEAAWGAALRFAERRRIGPFAAVQPDRQGRERAFAAMVRAGHPAGLVRKIVDSTPGSVPDADER